MKTITKLFLPFFAILAGGVVMAVFGNKGTFDIDNSGQWIGAVIVLIGVGAVVIELIIVFYNAIRNLFDKNP